MSKVNTELLVAIDANTHADYLKDESGLIGKAEYISFPQSLEELCEAASLCSSEKLYITINGGRTNIVGGATAEKGCVINLSKLKNIGEIQEDNGIYFIDVEAGVTLEELSRKINHLGYEFAPDPSESSATIGGLFSTNAKGGNFFNCGSVGDNVLEADIILASGERMHIKRGQYVFDGSGINLPGGERIDLNMDYTPISDIFAPQKGKDLLDYISGSSGSLCIAAKLRLRIIPERDTGWGIVFYFGGFEEAVEFCEQINKNGAVSEESLERLEILDKKSMELVDGLREISFDLKKISDFEAGWNAAVIVQLLNGENIEEELMCLLELFDEAGGKESDTWAFEGSAEVRKISVIRHAVSEGVTSKVNLTKQSYDGARVISSDHSVPAEKLKSICEYYMSTLDEYGLDGTVFGHAADSRVHGVIFPTSKEEMHKAEQLLGKWADMAISLGGRLFAENGIGRVNAGLLEKKMPKAQREAVDALKKWFDPDGILRGGF